MKLSEFLQRFVYTRKCSACSELLNYEQRDEAFCPECRAKWDKEKVHECSKCHMAVCECTCMTNTLASAGVLCHRKLVNYSASCAVVHNTLNFIKKNNNPRVTAFLASQLANVIRSDEDIGDISAERLVICHVPRGKEAILKYGHDQSALLAEALAEKLDIAASEVLKRSKKSAKAQKKLSAQQRAKNVKGLFEALSERVSEVSGKTVILVDDIVTTGASMAECARVLIKCGARCVIAVSVASTDKGK